MLATAYLAASVLLFLPSYLAWFRRDFPYTSSEFDPWIGLLANPLPGRIAHSVLCLIVGLLFVAIARRVDTLPRWLVPASWVVFAAAVPAISIDVFFYLAKGWLEFNYGVNPYTVAVNEIPAYAADPIFQSMVPDWLAMLGNYGPVFQKISALLAGASGGSPVVGLILFKLLSAVCLLLCRTQLGTIAARLGTPMREVDRWFLLNPLVLYCFLTAAHNDTLLMLAVLLGITHILQRHYWSAGCWVGVSISLKTIGVFLLPVLFVYLIIDRPLRDALIAAGKGAAGLSLGLLPPFALYQHSLDVTLAYIGGYAQGVRSSVFVLLDPLVGAAGLPAAMTPLELGRLSFCLVACWRLYRNAKIHRADPARFLIVSSFEIVLLAQLMTIPMMNEWYLFWPMCFAFCLNDIAARRWMVKLSVVYLPVVVWAIRGEAAVAFVAQLTILCVLLMSAFDYFRDSRPRACSRTSLSSSSA